VLLKTKKRHSNILLLCFFVKKENRSFMSATALLVLFFIIDVGESEKATERIPPLLTHGLVAEGKGVL
jgi:hypothetical protein